MTWPTVELGEICEFKYGKSLPASQRDGGACPAYGSNGIVGYHSSAITNGPTIIVGRKGSFGEVAYSPVQCWPIDTTYYIDDSCTETDLKWLSYRLNSLGLTDLNRAAAVPGLNREDAYRQRLLLPPLDEQRRIAAILDHADSLRSKRHRSQDNWDELSSSTFYEMFGDPVANPKGWPTGTLEDQVDSMQYGPRFYNESYSNDGVRIVRITDLSSQGTLDFEAMPRMTVSEDDRSKFELSTGDIIFARTGATVGKLALIRDEDPPSIAGAYFIRIRFNENVVPAYAAAVLRSASIQSIVVAGSHQSAQQNFSGPGLRALPFPVPPLALQQEFSSALSLQAKLRTPSLASAERLDELFASLQSRAFRGEL